MKVVNKKARVFKIVTEQMELDHPNDEGKTIILEPGEKVELVTGEDGTQGILLSKEQEAQLESMETDSNLENKDEVKEENGSETSEEEKKENDKESEEVLGESTLIRPKIINELKNRKLKEEETSDEKKDNENEETKEVKEETENSEEEKKENESEVNEELEMEIEPEKDEEINISESKKLILEKGKKYLIKEVKSK